MAVFYLVAGLLLVLGIVNTVLEEESNRERKRRK